MEIKQIAIADPALLFEAARLIKKKATLEDQKNKPAYALAKQLSQHRRWPWLFNSKRAYSTCAETLLDVYNKSSAPKTKGKTD